MPRHSYATTAETIKVLSNSDIAKVAKEWGIDRVNLYNIQSGKESDPYAKFRVFVNAVHNANGDIRPWIDDLLGISTRNDPVTDIGKEIRDYVKSSATLITVLMEALEDGQLDVPECNRILEALDRSRKIRSRIYKYVARTRTELSE